MSYFPPIYVASRASIPERPAMWKTLRAGGWNIISTWIDEAGPGETTSHRRLWQRIEREVASSRALILYAEPADFPLKGAFVEVGMALATGKTVFIYTNNLWHPDHLRSKLGSWISHPNVYVCDELQTIHELLTRFYHAD